MKPVGGGSVINGDIPSSIQTIAILKHPVKILNSLMWSDICLVLPSQFLPALCEYI